MRRVVAGGVLAAGAIALSACAQILGYEAIPDASPDAGAPRDAREAGHDATSRDTGFDTSLPDVPRRIDTGFDSGHDVVAPPACSDGNTRCSPSGTAVETCIDGVWGATACPAATPICIASICSCVPGATQCVGEELQQFQTCAWAADGGLDAAPPAWTSGTNCDAGTCSLGGCQPTPPSCAVGVSFTNGITDCPGEGGGQESCCATVEIPAGEFKLGFDGIAPYNDTTHAARIDGFRLDRFEVTVGRFRQFITAVSVDGGSWVPEPGAGKHTHLNAGRGLLDRAHDAGTTYETGWNPEWTPSLASLPLNFVPGKESLLCAPLYATWTTTNAEGTDLNAINCVTWAEAYAFCIWDGGFLPSEAEWDYAAAGGGDQRYYPWSAPYKNAAPDMAAGCNNANFTFGSPCNDGGGVESVGVTSHPDGGDSKWLQADMAGNVNEWTLDVGTPPLHQTGYAASCTDCALLTPPPDATVFRIQRGGSFVSPAEDVRASVRGSDYVTNRSYATGFRCARTP